MSTDGGRQPFWSADGATLSYEASSKLVGVQRGRETTINDESRVLAQRGTAPGELTLIRAKEQPEPKRELRMITGWTAGFLDK